MFIPSLFFFALAWGLRGPSLLACGLFGAGGGVLSLTLIILVRRISRRFGFLVRRRLASSTGIAGSARIA